jgi:hypothetical protein
LFILLQIEIFYGHLAYLSVIWYFFPVLVCCANKNLATLDHRWEWEKKLAEARNWVKRDEQEQMKRLETPRKPKFVASGITQDRLSLPNWAPGPAEARS